MNTQPASPPATWKLVAGFAAIFLIWGSTYLAIRFAVHTLPPFSMSGARFIVAGGVLYLWAWWREGGRPAWRHWGSASVSGALMMLIGMGSVAWVEQWVSSGLTALLIATNPAWMVLLSWLWGESGRPGWRVWFGLALGLLGMSMLVGPESIQGDQVSPFHMGLILFSTLCWVTGSLYSRRASKPDSPTMYTAMIMLTGGLLLSMVSGGTGEWQRFTLAQAAWSSIIAFVYLTTVGSLIVFTVYIWLMRVASPSHVATHAYVNPVVAVLLGWLIGGETLTIQIAVAALGIITGVLLMMSEKPQRQKVKEKEMTHPAEERVEALHPQIAGETQKELTF